MKIKSLESPSCSMGRPPLGTGRRWTGAVRALAGVVTALCLVGPQPGQALMDTFDATADAWIDQEDQSTNHGTDQTLHVRGRASSKQRTLVRFDLSSLPDCATVSEAKLRLHVDVNSLATSVAHRVHRMIVDWTEDVTWLTYDGTNAWVGGNDPGAAALEDATDTAATGTGVGFVEWDVTADVEAVVAGADNYGWMVKHSTEGGANTDGNNTIIEYAAREAAANHPQLVVTYELSNASCDDGNPCTDDTCTAGGCVYTNNTDPCDDGDACTDGDVCSGGSCTGGPPLDCNDGVDCTADSCDPQTGCVNAPDDGACDDGNVCTDDACDQTLGCQYTFNTDPCDDGDACTGGDVCSGGSCTGGPPLDCDDGIDCTTDSCDPQTGCVNAPDTGVCDDGNLCTVDVCVPGEGCVNDATPVSGCRTAGKSILLIKDKSDDRKDKLIWKWVKGEATSVQDFGMPASSAEYALCIYAGPDEEFFTGVTVPPSSLWKSLSNKGFKYKDKAGAADGVQGVLIKGSAQNKSRALVKAKGQNLPDASLGELPVPLVAQLVNSDTSVCWEATFPSIRKNTASQLKAKK